MPIPQCLEECRAALGAVSGGAEAIGGGRVPVEDRDSARRTLVRCAVRPLPPGSPPRDQESCAPHDLDANWTREGKARLLFFGYKTHNRIDQADPQLGAPGAKTYESAVADALIKRDLGSRWP